MWEGVEEEDEGPARRAASLARAAARERRDGGCGSSGVRSISLQSEVGSISIAASRTVLAPPGNGRGENGASHFGLLVLKLPRFSGFAPGYAVEGGSMDSSKGLVTSSATFMTSLMAFERMMSMEEAFWEDPRRRQRAGRSDRGVSNSEVDRDDETAELGGDGTSDRGVRDNRDRGRAARVGGKDGGWEDRAKFGPLRAGRP
ncbi:hypothetical protein HK101_005119 [Irineochytrium annulatum]|nr:hypothetical protein HK101_005119 [Irineochytrium annulatum]